ncbi:hypothetical protein Dsin_028104 [Dipteronia sinensis]|uniref:Uncharacterized protein n=1 Tax=Dipteronia sinensis TaxID=43782 RepID=A0AAE0DTY0_9ROSI|nr:hypothetical protein Dsin_028104 [Dipteronia sinensis]
MNLYSSVVKKCDKEAGGENPMFQRLYICLSALKKGWKERCKPISGLDGCFIKGFHTEQLLTIVRVDPNNQMYPVAYSLVEFKQCMERMKTESAAAHRWLLGKELMHWSRAFFKGTAMCGMLCNNMCESFNRAILNARDKPLITLMEMIRNYLMKRLVRKRTEVEKWHYDIGPKVFKFVGKLKVESRICHSDYSGNSNFKCSKCRQQGHNITTCDRRAATESIWENAYGTKSVVGTESVGGNAAETEAT